MSRWTTPREWAWSSALPDLSDDVDHLGRAERTQRRNSGGECLSLNQLEDDERPLIVLTGVEHRHDPGVAETGRSLRLAFEPPGRPRVSCQVREKAFDRDRAAEQGVIRLPDGGHAPVPDLLDQLVAITDHMFTL